MSAGDQRERIDYTNPWTIAGTLAVYSIFLFAVPPLLLLLPFVLVALVVLYLLGSSSMAAARKVARQRLASDTTQLEEAFGFGLTSALVMNDWGVVHTRVLRRPLDIPWTEITLVDEPRIALLVFHRNGQPAFEADLSQDRYFLAVRAIHSKIPGRTNFDVDAATGQSRLLDKLKQGTVQWPGGTTVSETTIQHGDTVLSWQEISDVREVFFPGDESDSVWELRLVSGERTIVMRNSEFADGRQIGNSGYDTIKALVALKLPGKATFESPPPLPRHRATEEFKHCRDVSRGAFSAALKSGKFHVVEGYFRHMHNLVEWIGLDDDVDVEPFYRDYMELLTRTGRQDEAASLGHGRQST